MKVRASLGLTPGTLERGEGEPHCSTEWLWQLSKEINLGAWYALIIPKLKASDSTAAVKYAFRPLTDYFCRVWL